MEVLLAAMGIPSIREGEKGELARPHSGHSTMPFHIIDSKRVARCFDVECSSQPSTSGAKTMCDSCNHATTHGGDLRFRTCTLAHLCEMADSAKTDARVETPGGIVISSDEIENEKTDTFLPNHFKQNAPPKGPEDFLSQITIEGTEHQQLLIRRLCLNYADIFSDKLAAKPARLPPFVIKVNKREWESPRNRTAVCLQTVRKEREIKQAIDEMLSSGVIIAILS